MTSRNLIELWMIVISLSAGVQMSAGEEPAQSDEVELVADLRGFLERTMRFAKEGRHDLALILYQRALEDDAFLAIPPEDPGEELVARMQVLEPLTSAIRKSIAAQSPEQRVLMNARIKTAVDVRIATRGDKPIEQVRREVAGMILCERGEKITFDEAIAAVKHGEYRRGYYLLFMLTLLGDHGVTPQADIEDWLRAAEAGVPDPVKGEAEVKRLTQSTSNKSPE